MRYPKAFQTLISHFAELPSVGPKMAERIVLYLFKRDPESLVDFSEALEGLTKLSSCERCFHIAEGRLCAVCSDEKRDQALICVVEEPLDVIAFERTGTYPGLYHVLGGVLEGSKHDANHSLRINELLERVAHEGTKEVILATNPTTEGDLTALYLKKKLSDTGVAVTRIARGLSTGGDIEYADELTLRSALQNRSQA